MSTRSVEEFLQGVVDRAGAHIAAHSACTLTAHRAARYSCAASSDEKATQADLVEYVTSAGPCVEAVERGVETVVPEVVHERDGYKHIRYQQLTALLIEAVKEQQALIEGLSARISAAEGR